MIFNAIRFSVMMFEKDLIYLSVKKKFKFLFVISNKIYFFRKKTNITKQ